MIVAARLNGYRHQGVRPTQLKQRYQPANVCSNSYEPLGACTVREGPSHEMYCLQRN